MKALLLLPLWPSVLVTTTVAEPAECEGVVVVMVVLLTTVTPVAAVPPRLTVAPDKKPVPVIVTAVPPLTEPEVGEIDVTLGAGLPPEELNLVNFATEGTPLLLTRKIM